MSKGYLYILECANGAYYTGSTKDLDRRLQQHQNGEGANFTKKHLPVRLVYYEEFQRIDEAFYREKQIQGWSRKKKESLMSGFTDKLNELAACKNDTHFRNVVSDSPLPAPFDSAQGAGESLSEALVDGTLSAAETPHSQNICLPCGLCCDGTLIGFVQLEREEVPAMRGLLNVEEAYGNGVFLQPCKNFCGSCGIYAQRPIQCAKFECQLLKSVEQNELDFELALEKISEVKQLKLDIEEKISALNIELQSHSFYFKIEELKKLLQQDNSEIILTSFHLELKSDIEHLDYLFANNF